MTDDFLITLFSKQQPRRNRVIFSLLKNQKSVSHLYLGLRYELLSITGIMPELQLPDYEARLQKFVKAGLLVATEPGIYQLTELGAKAQQTYAEQHYLPQQLNTMLNFDIVNFRQGFLLANQVVSELAYQNKRYYPFQTDLKTMLLVKQWVKQVNNPNLVGAWYSIIKNWLETLSAQEADFFVSTWLGHQTPGLALAQLDLPATWNQLDRRFWELDLYAKWVATLNTTSNSPLKLLWQVLVPKSILPVSAKKSFDGLLHDQSVAQLSQALRVKESTIREHWLAAAIWLPVEVFPYAKFLTPSLTAEFAEQLTGPIDTWEFATVHKTDDPSEFMYFRLYQIYQSKLGAK
ncbi:MAG: hypothetical protein LBT80_06695 [Lactobacillaceae bacterium]|nr:hypothetical protein [Lactobacillaceae bacterium]